MHCFNAQVLGSDICENQHMRGFVVRRHAHLWTDQSAHVLGRILTTRLRKNIKLGPNPLTTLYRGMIISKVRPICKHRTQLFWTKRNDVVLVQLERKKEPCNSVLNQIEAYGASGVAGITCNQVGRVGSIQVLVIIGLDHLG